MATNRLKYNVNVEDFIRPEKLDIAEIIEEVTSGKGYFMIPQLFSPQDIEHARNTTLYLIDTQGEKATHFQVNLFNISF